MAHFVILVDNEGDIETMEEHYKNQLSNLDAGLDLFVHEETVVPGNAKGFPINHKTSAALYTNTYIDSIIYMFTRTTVRYAYMLAPRSSIVKTPLRLSNSVGIIDLGYNGDLIACVDNLSDHDFVIKKNTRLFQIVPLNGMQLKHVTVRSRDEFEFDETKRGSKGFGSSDVKETETEIEDDIVNPRSTILKDLVDDRKEKYDEVVKELENKF